MTRWFGHGYMLHERGRKSQAKRNKNKFSAPVFPPPLLSYSFLRCSWKGHAIAGWSEAIKMQFIRWIFHELKVSCVWNCEKHSRANNQFSNLAAQFLFSVVLPDKFNWLAACKPIVSWIIVLNGWVDVIAVIVGWCFVELKECCEFSAPENINQKIEN